METQQLSSSASDKGVPSLLEQVHTVRRLKPCPDWRMHVMEALSRASPGTLIMIFKDNSDEEVLKHIESLIARGWGAQGGAAAGGAIESCLTVRMPIGRYTNVSRLLLNGITIGTACFVLYEENREPLVFTARHCLCPQPGKRIDTKGLAAFGQQLRHVVSFPRHDLMVLRLENASVLLKQEVVPFSLVGGAGLIPGMAITLVGFPLAADVKFPAIAEPNEPVRSAGCVCWLSYTTDAALGDYQGTMPNSSGGAVTLSRTGLVGCHLGGLHHEEGSLPRDDKSLKDQRESKPEPQQPKPQTAAATHGGGSGGAAPAAAEIEGIDEIEIDNWSMTDTEQVGHGSKKRKVEDAAQEGPVAGTSLGVAKLKYCVEHVRHKGSLGYFIPANRIAMLMELYERHMLKKR